MCGIVGLFSSKDGWSITDAELSFMRDSMSHRGPDDSGNFTHRDKELFVGFGHRRLSIIDLSPLGHQPMSTADETLWIIFNGEVFNFQDLRDQLVKVENSTSGQEQIRKLSSTGCGSGDLRAA